MVTFDTHFLMPDDVTVEVSEVWNKYSSKSTNEISISKSSHHWDLIQVITKFNFLSIKTKMACEYESCAFCVFERRYHWSCYIQHLKKGVKKNVNNNYYLPSENGITDFPFKKRWLGKTVIGAFRRKWNSSSCLHWRLLSNERKNL